MKAGRDTDGSLGRVTVRDNSKPCEVNYRKRKIDV